MTGFYSPDRPRLGNGLPTWTSTAFVALPDLLFRPPEPEAIESAGGIRIWQVQCMVGSSWAYSAVPEELVVEFLRRWEDDPEDCLRQFFGREPPDKLVVEREEKVVERTVTVHSAEDLGL